MDLNRTEWQTLFDFVGRATTRSATGNLLRCTSFLFGEWAFTARSCNRGPVAHPWVIETWMSPVWANAFVYWIPDGTNMRWVSDIMILRMTRIFVNRRTIRL